MAVAKPGDPALDRDVVQKFVDVHQLLVTHVDLLGDNDVVRNLGLDALDDVEMSLRQIRLESDRGRIAFSKYRTVRARQGVGGVAGTLSQRIANLEQTVAQLEAAAMATSECPVVNPAAAAEEPAQVADLDADDPAAEEAIVESVDDGVAG